jgi:hypothetical protein
MQPTIETKQRVWNNNPRVRGLMWRWGIKIVNMFALYCNFVTWNLFVSSLIQITYIHSYRFYSKIYSSFIVCVTSI